MSWNNLAISVLLGVKPRCEIAINRIQSNLVCDGNHLKLRERCRMVGCEQTRELLDPYFDNELEVVQAKEIEDHLEVCGACRHEFELIREQNEIVTSSIKNQTCDTAKLRAEIEAATVGKPDNDPGEASVVSPLQ